MSVIPDEYICPITQSIMTDPVIGSDGRTYERSAITEWLKTHTTSPITRETMTAASLKPNYALKSLIERYKPTSVTPVQSLTQVETDHYYALDVFQQETIGYISQPSSSFVKPVVPPVVTPVVPFANTHKRAKTILLVVLVIIILIIFINFIAN